MAPIEPRQEQLEFIDQARDHILENIRRNFDLNSPGKLGTMAVALTMVAFQLVVEAGRDPLEWIKESVESTKRLREALARGEAAPNN